LESLQGGKFKRSAMPLEEGGRSQQKKEKDVPCSRAERLCRSRKRKKHITSPKWRAFMDNIEGALQGAPPWREERFPRGRCWQENLGKTLRGRQSKCWEYWGGEPYHRERGRGSFPAALGGRETRREPLWGQREGKTGTKLENLFLRSAKRQKGERFPLTGEISQYTF